MHPPESGAQPRAEEPRVADPARLTALRRALIESLQRRGLLGDPRLAAAFDAVPRHLFLPDVPPERAYSDEAIVTKERDGVGISSSSQPAMMAIMLGQLDPAPGGRVLEIGAGTGYNAALLRRLVGPAGRVTTVDIDWDIVAAARAHLAAAGVAGVTVVRRDGGYGWPPDAPYDRIILTVGAADVLPAWVEQLRPGGLLVLPLWLGSGQFSVALRKLPDGTLASESLAPCGFMRLRGAFAGRERTVEVGDVAITLEGSPGLDPAGLAALLARPLGEASFPGDAGSAALWLYLRFRSGPFFALTQAGATWGAALLDTAALSGWTVQRADDEGEAAAPVCRLYGSRAAYERLLAHLADWDALGRPRLDDLRLLVYPRPYPAGRAAPPPTALTLEKPHTTLVLAHRGRVLRAEG